MPTMTEHFGENLLYQRYITEWILIVVFNSRYIGNSLSVGNLNGDGTDDAQQTTVPGTVPRRMPRDKPPLGQRKRAQLNGTQAKKQPSSPPPPTGAAGDRMTSMMSQATYVLENDKRKPLLVQSGLKAAILAAANQQQSQSKKSKSKETLVLNESSVSESL